MSEKSKLAEAESNLQQSHRPADIYNKITYSKENKCTDYRKPTTDYDYFCLTGAI